MEFLMRKLGIHYNQITKKFEYENGKEIIEVIRGKYSERWNKSEPRVWLLVLVNGKFYEFDKRRAEIAWGVRI